MSFLGLEKWHRMVKLIVDNGGPFKSLYKIWRYDTLKDGRYVGCDEFGNRYFENYYYMIGRSRWVEYNMKVRWDYDASQITPMWFGWIHYKTDKLPCEDPAKTELCNDSYACCWLTTHVENNSGTDAAYYPYTTTRPSILPWDGAFIGGRPCLQLP